eukprot:TRINITY_DN2958_c0_g1_i3.p2 TRINITY_DN2958_c0_g1~~TRINITY_DN2958_c0_g1_i3.p2  ORF type:complete len:123 (+),score=12.46 TRINITY_DN2958_c0_g1_i3:105-473(+)
MRILALVCILILTDLYLLSSQNSQTQCKCGKQELCKAITTTPGVEIFGFAPGYNRNYREYDWDLLTTVAWRTDPEFVCYMSSGQTLGVKAQRFRGHTSPHRNVKEKKTSLQLWSQFQFGFRS